MKALKTWIVKLKDKGIEFLKWVWKEVKDWRTLVLLAVVCVVVSLPVWGCYLLGYIFKWEWAFWVATAMWGFWMLPGAPFWALSISITLAIKKIYQKKKAKENIET